jgi:hypothetical protein
MPKTVGSSVNSIAFGVIFVGIVFLTIGSIFTIVILITGRIKNKTSDICSEESSRPSSNPDSVCVSILPVR